MTRWFAALRRTPICTEAPVVSVRTLLLAIAFATVVLPGQPGHAQTAPASETPVPATGEPPPNGSDGEAGTPAEIGPGTASGPPPLGNEAPPPDGGPPGGPAPEGGLAATAASPRASTATFPTSGVDATADAPYLYMGLGLGLLFLVGLGFVWSRGQRTDPLEVPEGVVRLSQPSFLAPALPSLSDGLQVWSVDPESHGDLLTDLLSTLADAHRVLVVSPSGLPLPPVAGGPVYRVDGLRPAHLQDPLDALLDDGGRWPVVLLALPADQLGSLAHFADVLPAGVGGIGLVSGAHDLPFPVIEAETTEQGWRLSRGQAGVEVHRTHDGRLVPRMCGTDA